ncbi:MAG TPA: hypothetical protein VM802_05760 [Chitinophaga sp.]|uniref:hypothetical protein n=1 Tax=Chitinophaga sp. TaxID=1869181 RepID=UPI002CC8F320|nr:hypothetical protein [Chitinophaga sp.]HVI44351.1 hypothetical protein [Chitinophaga sp.]
MKSFKDIQKEFTPKEIVESFIFSGTKSLKGKDRENFMNEFREHRKKVSDSYSGTTELISQLLQLKFQIEDYIKSTQFNKDFYFGYFLNEYISILNRKKKDFAQEIEVDPAELSQIINKHRKPTEKIIFRLEIHSNRNFPALLWFKVLEKERAYELMYNRQIIEEEKEHVKRKLEFSF